MCLANSSKYSKLINGNCLGKSNNIIYSDVPSIESDITCTSKEILSNRVRNIDLCKNPNTIVDKSDVNQNGTFYGFLILPFILMNITCYRNIQKSEYLYLQGYEDEKIYFL